MADYALLFFVILTLCAAHRSRGKTVYRRKRVVKFDAQRLAARLRESRAQRVALATRELQRRQGR